MKNMEQPISQNMIGEEASEKLYNTSAQSEHIETGSSAESPVSQINDNGSINLGKFKDAESLLKAYNSLQTEFTRKSQRLSELENSNTEFSRDEKINQAIKELSQDYDIAQQFESQIKDAVKQQEITDYREAVKNELIKHLQQTYKSANDYVTDENFLNEFIYSNQTIRDNIVRDYLANLKNSSPVRVVSNISSSIPISPPNNPSTIQEAGKMAKNIIKQV